jgi:hypothetical protein
MNKLRKQIILVLAVGLVLGGSIPLAYARNTSSFPNCRLGVGGVWGTYIGDFDLGQLNMGSYLDWGTSNNPFAQRGLPTDIDYIQMVRIHQDKGALSNPHNWFGPPRQYAEPPAYLMSPGTSQVSNIAANQPGSLWLIGNEIERVDWGSPGYYNGMDEITPQLYATAFHEIRETIKAADPTARIAIAGVIEPTEFRLQYLDIVWDSYQQQYGYSMGNDVDVWNIHTFALREVRKGYMGKSGRGADIPAGIDENEGFLSEHDLQTAAGYQALLDAHHDMDIFRSFIEDFRQWMADHGERNKPLIISEYGILWEIDWGDPNYPLTRAYLVSTFDHMFNATDPVLGYPIDQNRLVQTWVWYSVNDNEQYYHGSLFNASDQTLTVVGDEWLNYVTDPSHPLASQPQPNLLVANLAASPNPASVSPGGTVDVTLRADVANNGNVATSTADNVVVKFWDGVPNAAGSNVIATQILDDIPGCGRKSTVEAVWSGLPAGEHTWFVEAVPLAGEATQADNTASAVVTVSDGPPPPTPTPTGTPQAPPNHLIYLPLVLK